MINHPTLNLIWTVLAGLLLVVMVYRATLTQHETDQLFLNDEETDSSSHVEHNRIVAQVKRLRPICQGLGGATIAMSVLIAGIYVSEVLPYVHFR